MTWKLSALADEIGSDPELQFSASAPTLNSDRTPKVSNQR